jgi:hypothetical protein
VKRPGVFPILLLCPGIAAGRQGNVIYFLIVKISLNSQEFSRKTNHQGEIEPPVRLWFKILQCFGKFQLLETK